MRLRQLWSMTITAFCLGFALPVFSPPNVHAQSANDIFAGGTSIQIPGGDERLLVYGGIGSIDPEMRFAKLIDSHRLKAEAQDLARSASLGNTRVLTSREEILQALSERKGRPARTEDIEAAVRSGLLYVLTFVGSFEYYKKLESGTGADRLVDEHFLVGVTPVISRAEDGVVILATPSMQRIQRRRAAGEPAPASIDDTFARAYGTALPTALRSLERVVSQMEEGRGDRHMVMVTTVEDPGTRRLFGFDTVNLGGLANYCRIAVPCPPGEKYCRLVSSFVSQKMTETLSERGVAVVPPANWAGWSDSAKVQTDDAITVFAFAPTGGVGELMKLTQLSIDPSYAARKLVVQIGGLGEKDTKLASIKRHAVRFYWTPLQIQWFETPSPYECDRVSDFGLLEQRLEPPLACQQRPLSRFGETPTDDVRRMWGMVALMKAMGKTRDDGGNPCAGS